MKYLFLLSLISLNSYACQIQNNDFDFSYNIKGDYITYHIERKDKKEFKYFQRYYFNDKGLPAEFGFIVENSKKNYVSMREDLKVKNFYDLDNYYTNMLISVPYVNDNTIELPIPEKRMPMVKEIEEHVDFKKFISRQQIQTNSPNFYKEKKVFFEVRIVLDSTLDKCLIFRTNPIDYNMGPQIYWNIKKFYAIRIF